MFPNTADGKAKGQQAFNRPGLGQRPQPPGLPVAPGPAGVLGQTAQPPRQKSQVWAERRCLGMKGLSHLATWGSGLPFRNGGRQALVWTLGLQGAGCWVASLPGGPTMA